MLQSNGLIKFSELRSELGVGSQAPFLLHAAESGTYNTINSCSSTKPNGTGTTRMDEWYSYNHTQSCPPPPGGGTGNCYTMIYTTLIPGDLYVRYRRVTDDIMTDTLINTLLSMDLGGGSYKTALCLSTISPGNTPICVQGGNEVTCDPFIWLLGGSSCSTDSACLSSNYVTGAAGSMEPCTGGTAVDDYMGASVSVAFPVTVNTDFSVYVEYTSLGANCVDGTSNTSLTVTILAGDTTGSIAACSAGSYFPSGAQICSACATCMTDPSIIGNCSL